MMLCQVDPFIWPGTLICPSHNSQDHKGQHSLIPSSLRVISASNTYRFYLEVCAEAVFLWCVCECTIRNVWQPLSVYMLLNPKYIFQMSSRKKTLYWSFKPVKENKNLKMLHLSKREEMYCFSEVGVKNQRKKITYWISISPVLTCLEFALQ